MSKEYMSIGELATCMNVSVRTLQYYDEKNILKPSAMSEGGRRLYLKTDMIRLQQILSFKYLGFSLEEIRDHILPLDNPQDVAHALRQQSAILDEQIQKLQKAKQSIDALHDEVLCMQDTNFKKYAHIIELLRMNNKDYWIMKLFDEALSDHVQQHFSKQPELANKIIRTYKSVLNKAQVLKKNNEPYDSEKSLQLAQEWWQMILDFTEGDLSLLPDLIKFNNQKKNWNEELANIQEDVNSYLGCILEAYFQKEEILFPTEQSI